MSHRPALWIVVAGLLLAPGGGRSAGAPDPAPDGGAGSATGGASDPDASPSASVGATAATRDDGSPEADSDEEGKKDAERDATTAPGLPPIYVPPSRGAVRVRVGASTRGERPGLPPLEVLAPDHVSLTIRSQPVLWWYLGADTDARIDVVLIDDSSVEPLLEQSLSGSPRPGIHAIDLARHGVRLEPGRIYQWFVALVPDPKRRSRDVISGGAIQRVEVGPELRQALEEARPGEKWLAYARYGVWYDALDGISQQIRKDPSNRQLRELRSRLLRDGELPGAASWDRSGGGS